MSDALVSPAVGIAGWAVSAGFIYYCGRRLKGMAGSYILPLMGVLGAFVFAAQMLNFSIPGTGSSGHLGGGLLLAAILGPHAAFLVISSVLLIQAFLFADGGILALGCNMINLGLIPVFVAYPLLFRAIVSGRVPEGGRTRITTGSVLAAVAALQLGALGVVAQTVISGVADLPFRTFLLLMQPIHLVIGLVEGFVTAAVLLFVWNSRPGIFDDFASRRSERGSWKRVIACLAAVSVLAAGALSWFASDDPDGLEWSIARSGGAGLEEREKHGVGKVLEEVQERTSIFPGYLSGEAEEGEKETFPDPDPGTSVSGLVGGGVTFLLITLIAIFLKRKAGSRNLRPGGGSENGID
jgi:cobalt/nickel transport system permease protein